MTFRVEKQITWFQIPMQQICWVHVLKTLKALIDNILLVNILQNVCSNYGMQVSIHEVKDQVYISIILCPDNILESDDIFMTIELLKEYNLSERTLCIGGILEGIKILLKGYNLFGPLVNGFPNNTIGTLT